MIFGSLYMKKYGVLLNMINNSITFTTRYCTYLGASLSPITSMKKGIEILPKVNHEDLTPKRIL